MTRLVKLREIASARAGDKGDISNIAVWAYEPRHYPAIAAALTVDAVRAARPGLFKGRIRRYEMPTLHGLNFVIEEGLQGGVNASLGLDAHGKSFSFILLDLDIALDEDPEADTGI